MMSEIWLALEWRAIGDNNLYIIWNDHSAGGKHDILLERVQWWKELWQSYQR